MRGLGVEIGRVVLMIDHNGRRNARRQAHGKIGEHVACWDAGFNFMQQLIAEVNKPAAVKW